MMGLSLRCSCRGSLKKKLHILPVLCAYVFSLMMFTVNNLDNYQTNSVVHGKHTNTKRQLHRPREQGVFYSSIKIFNSMPPSILKLKHEKSKFQVALKEYLMLILFILYMSAIHQSNCLPSSTPIMSPTIIINDSPQPL